MPHEMYVTRCKICNKPNLTYFRYGVKEFYNKCECKQLKQNNMKIEIKENDYFKREHLVSYNFTVRTNGYNSWKIDLEVKCKDEKLNLFYYGNKEQISQYMEQVSDYDKAIFLYRNMKPCVIERVYKMLCDFPRYEIKPVDDDELLCTARTYTDAEDEQNDFTFETLIIDTWKI